MLNIPQFTVQKNQAASIKLIKVKEHDVKIIYCNRQVQ